MTEQLEDLTGLIQGMSSVHQSTVFPMASISAIFSVAGMSSEMAIEDTRTSPDLILSPTILASESSPISHWTSLALIECSNKRKIGVPRNKSSELWEP